MRQNDLARRGPAVANAAMVFTRRHILALAAAFATTSGQAASSLPLVFAAASLKTVLDDLRANMPEIPFNVSYAGSGVLARQILQGAPADLFLPANQIWMDQIADAGLLDGKPIDLLGNRLVLASRKGDAIAGLDASLEQRGRIAMGYVDAVPAGQYGKAALTALGIWDDIAPNVVQTENVRAALALVSRGEVPLAIVYETDVLADENTQIAAVFDTATYPPIVYALGILTRAQTGSRDVLDGLTGPRAQLFYKLHGFEVVS